MVLGALSCRARRTREIAASIRALKAEHGVGPAFELKWTKVSPGKLDLYLAAVDYFFQEPDLTFRALVVPDKSILDHAKHKQTHDDFYFKMYFYALRPLVERGGVHRVFLDVKDTRSGERTAKLREVLCNDVRDWDRSRISDIQIVRSQDVQQIQLADLLVGAVSYANRGRTESKAKLAIIQRIQERSGLLLTRTSPYRALKLNVFLWEPAEGFAGE
jgi:hypothetical protein